MSNAEHPANVMVEAFIAAVEKGRRSGAGGRGLHLNGQDRSLY